MLLLLNKNKEASRINFQRFKIGASFTAWKVNEIHFNTVKCMGMFVGGILIFIF